MGLLWICLCAFAVVFLAVLLGVIIPVRIDKRKEMARAAIEDAGKRGVKEERDRWEKKFEHVVTYCIGMEVSRSSCDICFAKKMTPVLVEVIEPVRYECQGVTTEGIKKVIKCVCLKCAGNRKNNLTRWS